MKTNIAKITSYLFHPLLMPTYAFIVLFGIKAFFSLTIPTEAKWRIIILVFITTFVFPAIVIIFLKNRNIIKSLNTLSRKERIFPYITVTAFYFLSYYVLANIQLSPIFHYFAYGAAIMSLGATIINAFWKISVHMIAIGGLLGMLLGLSFIGILGSLLYIIIPVFIAGLIGSARLQLQSHTQTQVYSGFLFGILGMLYLALYF